MREVTEKEIFCDDEVNPEYEEITELKTKLYPGIRVVVTNPKTNNKCKAIVKETYPYIALFEDVENPGRYFTIKYVDLLGRI